jgi:hypothetical protein
LDVLIEVQGQQYMVLKDTDWAKVLNRIDHMLRNPPDYWRPLQRSQRLVTTLYRRLINGKLKQAQELKKLLDQLVKDKGATRLARRQAALILTGIGSGAEEVKRVLHEALNDNDPWSRSETAVALVALGDNAGWKRIRADLGVSAQAEDISPDVMPEGGLADPREPDLAAAVSLAEAALARNPPERRYINPEMLITQLNPTPSSQVQPVEDFQSKADQTINRIAGNIIDGLTRQPARWNVFYWRYGCNLVCDLGCNPLWLKEGERLCRKCFDTLFAYFPKVDGRLGQAMESCNARLNAAGASH